jgi:hypothetical protein
VVVDAGVPKNAVPAGKELRAPNEKADCIKKMKLPESGRKTLSHASPLIAASSKPHVELESWRARVCDELSVLRLEQRHREITQGPSVAQSPKRG